MRIKMARMVMMTKLMLILMSKENHSIGEDIGYIGYAYDTINGNVVMATSESGCGDLILTIKFFYLSHFNSSGMGSWSHSQTCVNGVLICNKMF